jgi:hypothetical protein
MGHPTPGSTGGGAFPRSFRGLVLFALAACLSGCTPPIQYLINEEPAPRIVVDSFGASWSGPTGDFRVSGASVESMRVVARLQAPTKKAWLSFDHQSPGDPSPQVPDEPLPGHHALTVSRPEKALALTVTCEPACDPPETQALHSLADQILSRYPGGLFREERSFFTGHEHFLAWRLSRLAWLWWIIAAIATLVTHVRACDRKDIRAAGLAALATAVAAVVFARPAPANWYSSLLPAEGWDTSLLEKNGVAGLVAESGLRALLGWNDRVLYGFHLAVGAVAAALAYLSFRALGVPRGVSLTALLFTAVLPTWLRVIRSDAQHVLVAMLFFSALWGLAEGRQRGTLSRRLMGLASLLLLPLVRIEALALAAMVPVLAMTFGSWRRWLVLLWPTMAVLLLAAKATTVLFIERYRQPVSELLEMFRNPAPAWNDLPLFNQFVVPPLVGPRWFPFVMVGLVVLGALVQLRNRPRLFVGIAIAFVMPQLLLSRAITAEGMVGGRYVLPVFALLGLVAADGALFLAGVLSRLVRVIPISAIQAAVVIGILVAIVLPSRPAYAFRYAFQDEYQFLHDALAKLPRPARVVAPTVRNDRYIRQDLDCCLDPALSPLPLAYPDVAFVGIALDATHASIPAGSTETYWFESAMCSLGALRHTEDRNPGISAAVARLCGKLRETPGLQLVASGEASPGATWPFFADTPIPLRLYRLTPPKQP